MFRFEVDYLVLQLEQLRPISLVENLIETNWLPIYIVVNFVVSLEFWFECCYDLFGSVERTKIRVKFIVLSLGSLKLNEPNL